MKDKGLAGGVIGIILFVVVILVLFLGFDKVDADKVGVKDRFGVVLGKMDSGLRWTGLFVSVTEYPLTIQKISLDRIQGVDETGQSVFADIAVNFKIKNGDVTVNMYQEVATTGNMDKIISILAIEEKITESFKQVSVQYEAIEIIQKRDEVRAKTIERIEELFPKQYFEIVSITLSNIDFEQSFNDAIQLKKDNTQLAKAAEERVKQSAAEADQVIEEARGAAEAKKLEAEAVAYGLRLQKTEITPLMVQRNWIDKWNGVVPQWIIMGESGTDTNLLLQIPTLEDGRQTSIVG